MYLTFSRQRRIPCRVRPRGEQHAAKLEPIGALKMSALPATDRFQPVRDRGFVTHDQESSHQASQEHLKKSNCKISDLNFTYRHLQYTLLFNVA